VGFAFLGRVRMSARAAAYLCILVAVTALTRHGQTADPPKPTPSSGETALVERVLAARKDYHKSLAALYEHYRSTGDRERARWVEEEIRAFHLISKPSYRLDVMDVPPATLKAEQNIKEANDLFAYAMSYKDKGVGTELTLNQRRAEIILQEILAKHPTSDKIADVAYELGTLYEGKAFRQYDRAAAYFERSSQWRKGSSNDARLRAARIYDARLSERTKAIEMYKEVIAHDTDPARMKEADRRLAELLSTRK
jgi:tetratricopeptide (TPR) repeat protein